MTYIFKSPDFHNSIISDLKDQFAVLFQFILPERVKKSRANLINGHDTHGGSA